MMDLETAQGIAEGIYFALKPHSSAMLIIGDIANEAAEVDRIEIACIPLKEPCLIRWNCNNKVPEGVAFKFVRAVQVIGAPVKGSPYHCEAVIQLDDDINLHLYMVDTINELNSLRIC